MENATTPCHPKPLVNATCLLGEKGCYADGKCHYIGNCENKVVTKADRIRAMSDEELAGKLDSLYLQVCDEGYLDFSKMFCDGKAGCITEAGDIICDDARRKACIVHWLRRPAEENDHGEDEV